MRCRDYEEEDLKNLNASKWQLDLLELNPDYVHWGNFEDYMSKTDGGWDARNDFDTWKDFGPWELDDLNEVVNFYFEISRKAHDCPSCEGGGMNPETLELEKSWYDFEKTGKKWRDNITQDEVEALQKKNRLREYIDGEWVKRKGLTAVEVNLANKNGGMGDFDHDAINRWICVETRAKRLGVWGYCPDCTGGAIYDEDEAHVSLQLWWLHPRKGCSKGIFIKRVEQKEIPEIKKYLIEARERNSERFSRIELGAAS